MSQIIPTHSLKIEIPTVADLESMIKLYQKSWLATYPNKEKGISKNWVKQRTDAWFLPEKQHKRKKAIQEQFTHPEKQYIRVAREADGKIVAIIHCSKIKSKQHMNALYVDKNFQGTGLAYQLMDDAVAWLDTSRPVSLEVSSYNMRAINFYKKYSFEVVEGSEHLFANKIPTIDMVRRADKK